MEITLNEIADLPEGTYTMADVRSELSYSYGTIPKAVSMPDIVQKAKNGELTQDRKWVLFCMHGFQSMEMAAELRELGFDAYSMKDGYGAWLLENCMTTEEDPEIAASIKKNREFKEKLFSRFAKAINTYDLLKPNDKVAVCISGGKDSMLMALLFMELKKCRKFPFELVFLVMDPGYNELNRLIIENNAVRLGIPVTIFETSIFDAVYGMDKSPCYMCARMRRGHLYSKAKELGCNKIALGHHYDDVIETILMGMLWGAQVQTMMPKLHSTNFEGMELIRPMYLIREDDIKAWRDFNNLHFIQCACHFTDTCSSCREDGVPVSKRMATKQLIKEMKATNPCVESNIFNSVCNVNLDTVISYKENGISHNFLDEY